MLQRIITSVQVEKFKQEARKLKRELKISHTEALDNIAKRYDFDHWHQVTLCNAPCKAFEVAIINEKKSLIQLDSTDLKIFTTGKGVTLFMGKGRASGEERTALALKQAMLSPTHEEVELGSISKVMVSIVGEPDFSIAEYELVHETLKSYIAEDAEIISGVTLRQDAEHSVNITLIATVNFHYV